MKRRFAALLAATAIVGVASAFAANPFSDVTPSDWAYQAVSQLAAQGIINGYPDGTFQGGKDITRYEVAQMVAKAIAHEDRANAEQAAVINRLANEFASELNTLGVRVENLENRVGNVKFTGDARVKFAQDGTKDKKGEYSYRVRLNADAMVSEKTAVNARLKLESQFGDNKESNVTFDRLNVAHNFGYVKAVAGRQSAFLGGGLVVDSTIDGVSAMGNFGPVGLAAGYGYPVSKLKDSVSHDSTVSFAQLSGEVLDGVNASAYVLHGSNVQGLDNVYGVAVNGNLGALNLSAEYAKANGNAEGRDAWMVGAGYQFGPANLYVQYFREGVNSPIVETTYDQLATKNWKGFVAGVDYSLAQNVTLSAVYQFKGKTVDGKALPPEAQNSAYYAQLKYTF